MITTYMYTVCYQIIIHYVMNIVLRYLEWIKEQHSSYLSGVKFFEVPNTGSIQQVVNDHIIVINSKTPLRPAGRVFQT